MLGEMNLGANCVPLSRRVSTRLLYLGSDARESSLRPTDSTKHKPELMYKDRTTHSSRAGLPPMKTRKFIFALVALTPLLPALPPLRTSCADEPLRNFIDSQISSAWQREKLTPAPQTTDAEFLRRIYLDLVGTIPTHEQGAKFIDDSSAEKRDRLIEELLADPRYARHQGEVWDLILFGRHPPGYETDRRDGIVRWLERQFQENTPYDQWVRALLKAEGNSVEDGPPMYFAQYRNQPEDASEAISQTFLGVQLQCARCHDHPFETWTQLDFYGMAAFLSRLQIVSVGKQDTLLKFMVAEKSTGDILFTGPAKEQKAGQKGEPVKPKFLLGEPLAEPEVPPDFKQPKFEDNKVPEKPSFSRKDQLADWITASDNPFFARAIANRLWAQYLGRGLVHPVDNMSESNKPTHPELLDRLAAELKAHQFDLKWYIRELVSSKTYQLSSRGSADEPLPIWHEYGRVRPLSAEELLDSWRTATWYDAVEAEKKNKEPSKNRFHPVAKGYMLQFFGTPSAGTGDFQGGLHEHLFLNNGPLSQLVERQKGSLAEWAASSPDPLEQRIERLYLSTLTRRPTAEETERLKAFVGDGDLKNTRWQDVVWALVTCSEFRFNH